MEKLTKENWLKGHENDECFYLGTPDFQMIADVEGDSILTCEVDWNGYLTLAEAKRLADWVLEADPDYQFSIYGVATLFWDDEEQDAYLDEFGNDLVVIEEYNR